MEIEDNGWASRCDRGSPETASSPLYGRTAYATITQGEAWSARREHQAERIESSILLDIVSVQLIYGDHHVDPWAPSKGTRARDEAEMGGF